LSHFTEEPQLDFLILAPAFQSSLEYTPNLLKLKTPHDLNRCNDALRKGIQGITM
jgi:hypothetical protein